MLRDKKKKEREGGRKRGGGRGGGVGGGGMGNKTNKTVLLHREAGTRTFFELPCDFSYLGFDIAGE